eukprot:11329042-Alexandrium_andersonii.AAC.1
MARGKPSTQVAKHLSRVRGRLRGVHCECVSCAACRSWSSGGRVSDAIQSQQVSGQEVQSSKNARGAGAEESG